MYQYEFFILCAKICCKQNKSVFFFFLLKENKSVVTNSIAKLRFDSKDVKREMKKEIEKHMAQHVVP